MTQKTYNFHPASGTNVNTTLSAFPKGSGSTDNKSEFLIYGTDYLSDQTNYDFATFRATGSSFYLSSGKSGTGTLRPLIFSAGYASGSGNTNQLYLATDGKVGIGTAAPAQALHVYSGASTSYVEVEGTAGISYFGNDSNGHCVIQSGTSGKDIYFYNQAGGTPVAVIDHFGNWLMAGATPGTNAANVLVLSNTATAPTTSTDITQLFSKDISAGNATLAMVTETSVAADAALVSTDSLTVYINGSKYKIMLVAV